MGKRDLLSVHRGPGLAHWPASLSLSTKEYRRGHFLLRSVTSLIRLRARRDTSRRQTRLRGHFFLLLSPRGFERTCAYFSAMTARAVLVVAARREQTCPFLSALYVGNMSKRWEHVRRICTIDPRRTVPRSRYLGLRFSYRADAHKFPGSFRARRRLFARYRSVGLLCALRDVATEVRFTGFCEMMRIKGLRWWRTLEQKVNLDGSWLEIGSGKNGKNWKSQSVQWN